MNFPTTFKSIVNASESFKRCRFIQISLFTLILSLSTSQLPAQSSQTEIEIIQEAIGLDKKIAVANFMMLDEEADAFWKLYDEYERERKKLGKDRIKIIMDYASSYPDISEEKIMELYKRTKSLKKSFNEMQDTYFKRMKNEVGVNQAAQFWQLENYFNSIVQAEIYSRIPFIGDNLETN